MTRPIWLEGHTIRLIRATLSVLLAESDREEGILTTNPALGLARRGRKTPDSISQAERLRKIRRVSRRKGYLSALSGAPAPGRVAEVPALRPPPYLRYSPARRGTPITYVAAQLGHSKPTTTLRWDGQRQRLAPKVGTKRSQTTLGLRRLAKEMVSRGGIEPPTP
jgi:integrase